MSQSEPLKDPIANGKDDLVDDDADVGDDPMQSYEEDDDGKEDDDDEVVVQEIDVYLNASPLEDGASLYVMQYPLRPSWRPYELERCEEVRVKPKQAKVEVDLKLDTDRQNYDPEKPVLNLENLTLSSSRGLCVPYFAVGIRNGNQLHLSPVDSVVQLRPSINVGEEKRKQAAPSIDANTNPLQGNAVSGDSSENLDDADPWVSLECHSIDSPLADSYQKKMVAEKNNDIQFTVKPHEYISFLCPGSSSNKKGALGPSKRDLLLLPLEERLKKWFSEGPQVNRFSALLHLAPTNSVEDVLKVLKLYAHLVQGLWVAKSSLVYIGVEASARDYILSLFAKNCVIRYDTEKRLPPLVQQILGRIAVHRPSLNDWKFKEPTDLSFIKCYPDIVKEQEQAWAGRVKQLRDSLVGAQKTKESQFMDNLIKSLNPHLLKKTVDLREVKHTPKDGIDNTVISSTTTMLNGTREDINKALLEIFHLHGARRLDAIRKDLTAATHEVQSALSEVAVNIHGVYVLKSPRNPALKELRNFIISLFRQKKANVKFRELDVRKAAQNHLKRNISDSEFKLVINEFCICTGGGVALKSGDSDQK
ncbi:DNA-directed RNA polymerase III subunit RPC5 isoform X2 [Asparagus officinalis]|uniref:DNA-directed RNA polymerase III subunit RPC5 isoform X2 n=1 Tax=Asparagus officinalis TaxID=4686 RepID=UPI00098E0B23|nr:DNA-directed RNA polymerase III subunit RPC5 isoform X2 [Asparagus officinalis]